MIVVRARLAQRLGDRLLVVALFALALVLIWWRGPDWGSVLDAFRLVVWSWIVLAFLLNVVSTLFRALSWRLTIGQALPEQHQPRLDPRPLRVRRRALRERGAARPARRARPGRDAAPPPPGRAARDERHPRRDRDRPPALRPRSGDDPRHLGAADRRGPALGGRRDSHRRGRRVRALHRRLARARGATTARWSARAWARAAAARHGARQGLSVLKAPVPLAGAILLQCLGWLMQLLAVWAR